MTDRAHAALGVEDIVKMAITPMRGDRFYKGELTCVVTAVAPTKGAVSWHCIRNRRITSAHTSNTGEWVRLAAATIRGGAQFHRKKRRKSNAR